MDLIHQETSGLLVVVVEQVIIQDQIQEDGVVVTDLRWWTAPGDPILGFAGGGSGGVGAYPDCPSDGYGGNGLTNTGGGGGAHQVDVQSNIMVVEDLVSS